MGFPLRGPPGWEAVRVKREAEVRVVKAVAARARVVVRYGIVS